MNTNNPIKKSLSLALVLALCVAAGGTAFAKKGGNGQTGNGGGGGGCDLQFDATFNPYPSTDGLRSDTGYPYTADGGEGFRLYTTGGENSGRTVIIDFDANNTCAQSNDPAGFCIDAKAIDMRIERQVQQIDRDLCSLDPDPNIDSFRRTIQVNFESGPIDDNSLVDPNRKGNPNKPQKLKLSYGCEADFVPPAYLDPSKRAEISRNGNTWTIVGLEACLMTQTGEVLLKDGEPVWFKMPFGLYLEETN